MTTPDQNGPSAPTDREAIEADIAATRADLGETVDALSRKLDVKSRVSAKAAETTKPGPREGGRHQRPGPT